MEDEQFETVKVNKGKADKDKDKRFLWSKHPEQETVVLKIIEAEFKDRVNAKSVPTQVWEAISQQSKIKLNDTNFDFLQSVTATSVKSLFRGLKTSFLNYKEGKISKQPRHSDLIQAIIYEKEDSQQSFSVSGSPVLKSTKLVSKITAHTPVERQKTTAQSIMEMANAAQPTPVLSILKPSITVVSKKIEICAICGSEAQSMDHDCLESGQLKVIDEALEMCEKCPFCKAAYSQHVSASFKLEHLKNCSIDVTAVATYLKNLKNTESNQETPLINGESLAKSRNIPKSFEFLKPAPRVKQPKKKESPQKNTLFVADESGAILNRKSSILNPKSTNEGTVATTGTFQQSIRVLDGASSTAMGTATSASLFSMGNGSISIKKKIQTVSLLNPESSQSNSQPHQQRMESSPKRSFEEFEQDDRSHLLEKARERNANGSSLIPSKNDFLNLELLSEIEQMDPENQSFLVISPKRARADDSYQFLSCSQDLKSTTAPVDTWNIKRTENLGISSIQTLEIPSSVHIGSNLGFSDIASIDIPSTVYKLDSTAVLCHEFIPIAKAAMVDAQVGESMVTMDASIQTDTLVASSHATEDALLSTQRSKFSDSGLSEIPSVGESDKFCLQVSEGEDEIIGREFEETAFPPGSDQDLFTPEADDFIPDHAVSQDLSRNCDEDVEIDEEHPVAELFPIMQDVIILTDDDEADIDSPAEDVDELESENEDSENFQNQNLSQASVASTVIECTQQIPTSSKQTLFSLLKKSKKPRKKVKAPLIACPQTMPSYSTMDLNELQVLADQYGLRPNGRKFLISKLTEIWKSKNGTDEGVNASTSDSVDYMDAIKSDTVIYQKILCYEPLDIEEVIASLSTTMKVAISRRELQQFLDEQGINVLSRRDQ